ncbi:hypothetical protein BKA67DRAFT_691804 [Truncatella angustata]|uniref:Uncharacterized protein n=1 Tax=Truncatella angustata TaxID=152316 RepID=A0A9P8UMH2_9PEZI|nr:uncharacterized protein BKA67DRAFT_691804 [Truncatella angustata]KAH6654866.1 hypothetical protein BKA67DRAFT_691804 [Truncatella angustata]
MKSCTTTFLTVVLGATTTMALPAAGQTGQALARRGDCIASYHFCYDGEQCCSGICIGGSSTRGGYCSGHKEDTCYSPGEFCFNSDDCCAGRYIGIGSQITLYGECSIVKG